MVYQWFISKVSEEVHHFPEGRGGVQMLISIETHITCDFQGGTGPPIPLWTRA